VSPPPDASAVATATAAAAVAAVVPAHRDSAELLQCLQALVACDPPPDELVVVVDGGDAATLATAERFADEVVTLPRAGGPARARNAGVGASRSPVVFFVDSDVVVPSDTIARLQRVFSSRPDLDGLIGSYDDEPPAPGLVSQYKNLLNHHVHQTAEVEGSTFWGACGAVRRHAFEAVGGFDERYTRPCVEDIELGHRLAEAGFAIEVKKDLQVTHLKHWTAASMVRADVLDRAVPWSELIVQGAGFIDDLNISRRQRVKAGLAVLAVLAVALQPHRRHGRRAVLASVAALTVLDLPLLRFLAHKRGVRFALGAAGWHWLSYVYSAGTFALVAARATARRLSSR
jgi:glycosyltransferase involved in cell wall biosynthesis